MAPLKCCVTGCKATSDSHCLHSLPRDDKLRNLWLSFLLPICPQLNGLTIKQLLRKLVCHQHFDRYQMDRRGRRMRLSYPTLFSAKEIAYGIPLSSEKYKVLIEHNYFQQQEENGEAERIITEKSADIKMEPQEEHNAQIDEIQRSHLDDPLDVMKIEPDDVDSDIKMEPQEEHNAQINDIQCSHLDDPLDVMKIEPDHVDSVTVTLPASCVANNTMTKNLKVLVSSNDLPQAGLKILQEHFTVVQTKYLNFGEEGRTLAKEDLLKLIPGCSALVWISNLPISKELLDKAGPQLKIVATVSAGYNHCNLDELRARGIKLSNTPNVLSSTVAEIAVALMLGTARRFTENLAQVARGEWEIGFDKVLGQDVRGSTVGIVGLGSIGQAVVKRLAGFEVAKFVYSGHREKPEGKALGAEFVTQDQLLAQSDFIVLAVPLTNETRHMINKDTLSKMKSNAIVINVGRGDLIDQDALYDALKNKQIYAAGLDVTTPEPLPKDHKLLTLPNLFVLPHIGSATVRTRSDMGALAANNVVNALTGKPLITPVHL